MTPADLGWDVTRQAGRPSVAMTRTQARAWAARVENLVRIHPGRSPESLCRDLGLDADQTAAVVAVLEEEGPSCS